MHTYYLNSKHNLFPHPAKKYVALAQHCMQHFRGVGQEYYRKSYNSSSDMDVKNLH